MADYIDREELLKQPTHYRQEWDGRTPNYECIATIDISTICSMPSVDAVEVVRCKDCKHRILNESQDYWCNRLLMLASNGDFFCKWGEKE